MLRGLLLAGAAFVAVTLHGCGGGGGTTSTTIAATTTTVTTAPPVATTTTVTTAPPLPLPSWFEEAFNDVSKGLSVSCGASPKGKESPASISVLSRSLPMGLFLGEGPALLQGVVFKPDSFSPLCAFPCNAYTSNRQNIGPAAKSTLPKNCGVFDTKGRIPQEWRCNYSARDYVAKFYDYPLMSAGNLTLWQLSAGTCHFENISLMLQAEQDLLQQSITPPTNVSEDQWNSRLQGGPTFWNEVVIKPFGRDEVAGVFWSHSGAFRKPQIGYNDTQACIAAHNLKEAGPGLPVFEFAELPFKFHFTVDDLKAWNKTLQAGGNNVANHFRLVDRTEFLALLDTDLCKSMNDVQGAAGDGLLVA